MARRGTPEISAGSMADIAFLLLIFFIVTSSMEKESGMMRLLPEWEVEITEPINERNVIQILVNDRNEVTVEDEPVKLSLIKTIVSNMILNERNNLDWPENIIIEKEELEVLLVEKLALLEAKPDSKNAKSAFENAKIRLLALETFGSAYQKSKHVVSIQSTRGAEYATYIEVSDQILLAYKVMKEKAARRKWNRSWSELSKEEKSILNIMYKSTISEAQTVQGQQL